MTQARRKKAAAVLAVLMQKNAARLKVINPAEQMKAGAVFLGEDLPPLQENKVHYFGQFIAVVVAETYEQARSAATLLKVTYTVEKHAIDLKSELPNGFRPEKLFGEEAQINAGKGLPPHLYTLGFILYLQTYPGSYVPRPWMLSQHAGESSPKEIMREILALTKMNINNCS